jgi:hypothetical protein
MAPLLTKQQLQDKLKATEAELAKLKKFKDSLGAEVNTALVDCIDEYGLDVCQEGLVDFCDRIGVEYVLPKRSAKIDLQFQINLPQDAYGDPDTTSFDNLIQDFEIAMGKVGGELWDIQVYWG